RVLLSSFFNYTPPPAFSPLSLHDALPICAGGGRHSLALLQSVSLPFHSAKFVGGGTRHRFPREGLYAAVQAAPRNKCAAGSHDRTRASRASHSLVASKASSQCTLPAIKSASGSPSR